MLKRVRFSNAPHKDRELDALFEALICFINISVASWLNRAWQTVQIQWVVTLSSDPLDGWERRFGPKGWIDRGGCLERFSRQPTQNSVLRTFR
jgi:hypothetical protein